VCVYGYSIRKRQNVQSQGDHNSHPGLLLCQNSLITGTQYIRLRADQ
jgi:hypothetical protein